MDLREQNPYAAPPVVADVHADALSDDVRVRTEHIGCEQEVRSIGWLMTVGGVLVVAIIVPLGLTPPITPGPGPDLLTLSTIVLAMFAQVATGIGLLMLRRWALAPAIVDCVLWLLFVPIGTVIGLAALWILGQSRVAFVLTDEYRGVILMTPGIRRKTPRYAWAIFFVALLAMVVFVSLIPGLA